MPKPIEFKAGTLATMTAIVRELDNVRLADAMHTMLGGKGEFFADEMAIVDLSQLKKIPAQVDWAGLSSLLRRYGLQPVALKNLPETLQESARKAGFAILANGVHETSSTARDLPTPAQPVNEKAVHKHASVHTDTVDAQAMIVDRFVRSGQQVYAKNRDLIVLCGVSHGAEIIADGNIHCYGPLRGRALAGAQGNTNARLFCTNFGPELVSIAGVYRTFEKGIAENVAGKPAYAMLRTSVTQSGEGSHTLSIEPLQLD